MKKLLAILIVLTLLLCPLPTLAEDAPEGLLGGWRLVKLRADCDRYGFDVSASLHMHKERGTHLTFGPDGSLDTDVNVFPLLISDLTFDIPEMSVMGKTYTCSDGGSPSSQAARPSGIPWMRTA